MDRLGRFYKKAEQAFYRTGTSGKFLGIKCVGGSVFFIYTVEKKKLEVWSTPWDGAPSAWEESLFS